MSKNLYMMPLLRKEDNQGHPDYQHPFEQKYAEDFLCDVGSFVYAVASGEVIRVFDEKEEKAREIRLRNPNDPGNNILIKHSHDEYSYYAHLKKGSSLVRKGERVRTGQQIALSGNTGYSLDPHLHFSVITRIDKSQPLNLKNFKTIPIKRKK